MKFAALAVLGTVVVSAIAVGCWFGYWALAEQSQTNQYKVNTDSQQYQASVIDQERDRIQGYDASTDPAQKAQIASTFCASFPSLTLAPADLVMASARICK
jgi:hypothetical protein